MTLTEAEAKKRWCPFSKEADATHDCIASRCMAWRWVGESQPIRLQGEDVIPRGQCGLAGKGGQP